MLDVKFLLVRWQLTFKKLGAVSATLMGGFKIDLEDLNELKNVDKIKNHKKDYIT